MDLLPSPTRCRQQCFRRRTALIVPLCDSACAQPWLGQSIPWSHPSSCTLICTTLVVPAQRTKYYQELFQLPGFSCGHTMCQSSFIRVSRVGSWGSQAARLLERSWLWVIKSTFCDSFTGYCNNLYLVRQRRTLIRDRRVQPLLQNRILVPVTPGRPLVWSMPGGKSGLFLTEEMQSIAKKRQCTENTLAASFPFYSNQDKFSLDWSCSKMPRARDQHKQLGFLFRYPEYYTWMIC